MTSSLRSSARRKNLLVFHLESVAWQRLTAFPEAFPHLHRLMETSRVYRSYFSSATSTQMAISAFMHGNDGEFDAASGISQPAGDTESLFVTLREAGYETSFLCATATVKPMLPLLSASIPAVWSTNDFRDLVGQFEQRIEGMPFAIYIWNLLPHIETNIALAPYAESIEDLIGGACAVTDALLGEVLDILRRRGLLEDTTIIAYGDHGDDHWTHGFKNGLLHGLEPFTPLVHTPLVISDADVSAGIDNRLASTVDLAPTCLQLLGLSGMASQYTAGVSLMGAPSRSVAFSQNFAANQPDAPHLDVRRSFAAIDRTHVLMVSSRGLEFYGHKLDPGNHSNLLHHFELTDDGLRLLELQQPRHPHFNTVRHMWLSNGALQNTFANLRRALKDHVAAKNAYVKARKSRRDALEVLDLQMFDRVNRYGRDSFFGSAEPRPEETIIGAAPRRSQVGGVMGWIWGAAAVTAGE
ncbi:sulfatase-like hydrolase/transferase [Hyphomicrobium facile]|uniref:Sulfatase n=1 Tax=Hyphomicrobium facile TaxID=51670 RepID=A0A1I7NWR3_9HYPH|nr:sulfatase-like hydrolase/transferase [Hyphomicrobium facile]SFV39073.1 Sulfatase [Hyphomicrobium facile]